MKFIIIHGGNIDPDSELNIAMRRLYNILEKKNLDYETIFLEKISLPYYKGNKIKPADEIFEKIKEAKGILLMTNASFFGVSAYMKVFMEYLKNSEYSYSLKNKYLFSFVVTKTDNENDISTKMLTSFLEYDVVPLGAYSMTESEVKSINESKILKLIFDHKFDILSHINNIDLDTNFKEVVTFNNKENSINEIAQIFKKQLEDVKEEEPKNICNYSNYKNECENKTACYVDSYNKEKLKDLKAIIQLNIEGVEPFNGFIMINPREVRYKSGKMVDTDLTITTSSTSWSKIADKKLELERAFMTGEIKVKGNFMILKKIDEIMN